MLSITALLTAAFFAHITFAGKAISIQCSTHQGESTAIGIDFYYDEGECPDSPRRLEALSGPKPAALSFLKFCGGTDGRGDKHTDRFCGNIDIFPDAGWHISLDGKEVSLGPSDKLEYYDIADKYTRAACDLIGYHVSKPYDAFINPPVNTWNDVKLPCA